MCRAAATTQKAEAVHALPDDGSRERVCRQLVHHAPEALGDLVQVAPERAPGQGMVPEQAHEAEEAERPGQGSAQGPGRLAAASVRRRGRVRPLVGWQRCAPVGKFDVLGCPSAVAASSSPPPAASATSAARRLLAQRRTSNDAQL